MSEIKNELQQVEKKIEEGVVEIGKKFKETLANVASHLPLANLSRNKEIYRRDRSARRQKRGHQCHRRRRLPHRHRRAEDE